MNTKAGKPHRKPQGVRIEGLISKRVIKLWLDEWDSLEAGDILPTAFPSNTGPKARDGITNKTINKIMLEAAVKDLPPVLKVCLQFRWIDQLPLKETLERTGIPKTTYYRRCDKAVEFLYYHVNGMAAGMKDLLDKILVEKA